MMKFNEQKAIYLQIAELVEDNIISGAWAEGERMLSVREFGVQLAVNPATVLRAYDELSAKEEIEQRRGIGYFVHVGAAAVIKEHRKETFLSDTLPKVWRQMQSLGITVEQVIGSCNEHRGV